MKRPNKRPPPPRRRPVPKEVSAPEIVTLVPSDKRFVYKAEVLERIGVSFVIIWQWVRDGKFPVPREVGGRTAWYASEIDQWMENRPKREYRPRLEPRPKSKFLQRGRVHA